jgi:hypothetical protein
VPSTLRRATRTAAPAPSRSAANSRRECPDESRDAVARDGSTVGKEAWRSFKSRAIGFSFGYLIPDGGFTPRPGGGRLITALDVFEVTATPTPMNNDTRVLSTKGISAGDPMLDALNRVFANADEVHRKQVAADALREKAMRIARECAPIQVATFECN